MSTIVNVIVVFFLIAAVITLGVLAWRYYKTGSIMSVPILNCVASFPSMEALTTWEANFPNVTFVLTHLDSNKYTLVGTNKMTNITAISCNITIGN